MKASEKIILIFLGVMWFKKYFRWQSKFILALI